jgi:hypothetical protein
MLAAQATKAIAYSNADSCRTWIRYTNFACIACGVFSSKSSYSRGCVSAKMFD